MEQLLESKQDKIVEIVRLKQIKMESEYSNFQLRSTADVVPFIQELIGDDSQEALVEIFLNIRNKVTAFSVVFRGKTDRSLCSPKQVVQRALLTNSMRIILAHNHPAGSLEPSLPDKNSVNQMSSACELMDIELLDNFIITTDGYYSFLENGLLTR